MTSYNSNLVNNLDDVLVVNKEVVVNTKIINRLIDETVNAYCKELDEYIKHVKSVVQDPQYPPTNQELETFILNLPTMLYFISDKLEYESVAEDIVRALRSERYNEVYVSALGTAGNKASESDLATQRESLIVIVKQHTVKKIKARVEMAFEVLQSCKKILTMRMTETQLSVGTRQ